MGKKEQNAEQKRAMADVFAGVKGAGILDFVAAWYIKAAQLIEANPSTRAAFVSTNSITQGEQVGVLWSELYRLGMHIQFAHRTFKWSNEARGRAAVHCVIVGFGHQPITPARLFDYSHSDDESSEHPANEINPYLVDAPAVLLEKRMRPISQAPEMDFGSKAADFGHLTLSQLEKDELVDAHPDTALLIREFIGAEEFLNGSRRYCLWLKGISATDLRRFPPVVKRLEAVSEARAASADENTRRWANVPALFQADRQPSGRYLLVPKVTSERRRYIPLGFCDPELIVNPSVLVVPHATLHEFGVLQSLMHMAWTAATGGRLESRFQYSNTIVYNNFPWPEFPTPVIPAKAGIQPSASTSQGHQMLDSGVRRNDGQEDAPPDKHRAAIEFAAQTVLDTRTQFPDATLADLYDPLTMPPALVKAHQTLDRAVDAAYIAAEKGAGRKAPKLGTDAERVAFLFERYQALTSLLPATATKRTRKARA